MKLNKKITAAVLTVAVALAMTPAIAFTGSASAETGVAKIGNTEYDSLQAAVDAVTTSDATTITLEKDTTEGGVVVPSGRTIEFNLGGKTFTINKGVGSAYSQTNGMQLLKDSDITIENGTIESSQSPQVAGQDKVFKAGTLFTLIQNYSNLTLDKVTMNGVNARTNAYLVSNNCGNTSFKNTTFNTTCNTQHSFDSDHNGSYTSPVVTVNDGCSINGNIETSHEGTNDGTNGKIIINGGSFVPTTAGSAQCVLSNIAASKSAAVTLGADMTGELSVQKNTTATLDLNGHNITGASTYTDYNAGKYDAHPTINNAGTLTVKGTGNINTASKGESALFNTEGGNVTCSGGDFASAGWYSIRNEGTMSLADNCKADTNNAVNASTIINGKSSHTPGTTTDNAKLTITGGEYTGYYNVIKNGDTKAELDIQGGTFTVPAGSSCTSHNVIKNYGTCTAEINGGTFKNGTASGIDFLLAKKTGASDYTVKGGTFGADPSAYVASGYTTSRSNGLWTVSQVKHDTTPVENTLTLSTLALSLTEGGTGSITATPSDKTQTVKWSSSDSSIAAVTASGNSATVTAGKDGIATITASVQNNGREAITASCTVEVLLKKGEDVNKGGEAFTPNHIAGGTETMAIVKIDKKAAKVTIPSSVKIEGISYDVTEIAKNLMRNDTHLKSLTIGSKITTIRSGAMRGCKNLKYIKIKSTKITKIEKTALKGVNSRCKVNVPNSKINKYGKMLRKAGLSKKAKVY